MKSKNSRCKPDGLQIPSPRKVEHFWVCLILKPDNQTDLNSRTYWVAQNQVHIKNGAFGEDFSRDMSEWDMSEWRN